MTVFIFLFFVFFSPGGRKTSAAVLGSSLVVCRSRAPSVLFLEALVRSDVSPGGSTNAHRATGKSSVIQLKQRIVVGEG